MGKYLKQVKYSGLFILILLTLPYFFYSYALADASPVTGCFILDQNSLNIPIPLECQTNGSVACNSVATTNTSYTVNGHSVSVTVWNCNHAAPLVIFVPGRGRSASDYGRYENAIAVQGFTVAGVNFGSENDGGHFSEEESDVKALIGSLQGDSKLNIQKGGVGLVGHSDGGLVTSMEGYQGSNNASVKAIISADGFASGGSSGPPLLLLHGSKDQLDPSPPDLNAYSANPKYHAEIIGADHFCYVAEKSVPGYAIDCATAGLQPQTQALDAITGAFLQLELLNCGNSVSSVASQYKNYITLQQSGNISTSTPCSSGAVGGLTNPFPGGWQPSRLDMGYDGTFKGSIVAPFAGTIVYAATGVATWGGYIEVKANQKPAGLPTSTIYFAEGFTPTVKTGDRVTAGQKLATPAPNIYNGISGNIEFGVSEDGAGYVDTYAIQLGAGTCPTATKASTAMVLDFAKWVETNLHMAPPSATGDAGCA